MGATVLWQPVKPRPLGGNPADNCPSAFIETLTAVFGPLPIKLNTTHLVQLETLAKAFETPDCSSWENIINAIDTHGAIRLFAEH